MGKRADKAKLKELMAKQQKRQDQHVAWHDRERAKLIRRYYLGVVNPERYYKYAVAHRMIQMLAQLEDYYLATIEDLAPFGYADPKGIKLFKEARKPLDPLINHMDKELMITFTEVNKNDEQTARHKSYGVSDLANEIGNLLEKIVGLCPQGVDDWRFVKIRETAKLAFAPEWQEHILEECRDYCIEYLTKVYDADLIAKAVQDEVQPEDLEVVPLRDYVQEKSIAQVIHPDLSRFK